ncbi:MAG TPA: preprotein translocase subunit SecE [Candidatus Brocadiia bacterium]|nr:preprotein translocase subunit SecE [Candidatus Brocadiia bacterium]
MKFEIYRPGQGVAGRTVAATALGILALFAAVRTYNNGLLSNEAWRDLGGLNITPALCGAVACLLILGFVVALFCCGWTTGIGAIDKRTRAFNDLMVDTQAEMQKVAWPSREELYSSTAVVVAFMLILGVFIASADITISAIMRLTGVLPG